MRVGVTEADTHTAQVTGEGAILGTLSYLPREQVEGREADHRSDIFAFGATVYEMVTGKKAFDAKSPASVIAAILKNDPPLISTAAPLPTPPIDRIVQKCLAKEPERRWQSAADLADELKWIRENSF